MINEQFPTSYDVQQTLSFVNTGFEDAKQFVRARGLIHVGSNKVGLANAASNILFDHQSYVLMRTLAQGGSVATNISGFTLKASTVQINSDVLMHDIDAIRERLIKDSENSSKKGVVSRELDKPFFEDGLKTIKTNFKYQRLIPGRVELMHRVDTNVEITIEEVDDLEWRVICYPEANQDVAKVEELFSIGSLYVPYRISLDNFTRTQKINFFDEILIYYSNPE